MLCIYNSLFYVQVYEQFFGCNKNDLKVIIIEIKI